jgi:NAD(P)H-dependent flavin oxidoreductase YrpB (nitropropane dioxygenase family)
MQQVWTPLCDHLGIDYPIFGFAHDIATVAAITNAGVYGVYAATRRFPDEIREELALIRSLVGEKSFGVDLVLPTRMPEHNSREAIEADISGEHKSFVVGLIEKYQPPSLRAGYANPLYSLFRD